MNQNSVMLGAKTIAVVDDNIDFLESLVSILRRHGFEACGFNDPVACLELMSSWKPDLVLSDYEMPQMSGLVFLHNVRLLFPDLPCLLVTGSSSMELTRLASAAGCAAVVAKPFEMKFLIDMIHRCLNALES